MSEYYNCTICRGYPCSCGTAVRTNLNIPDDPILWQEVTRLKEQNKKMRKALEKIVDEVHTDLQPCGCDEYRYFCFSGIAKEALKEVKE